MSIVTKILLHSLAYMLLKCGAMHFHRVYAIMSTCNFYLASLVHGKRLVDALSIRFAFSGRGAQLLQME
jgi:hypothetical protein